LLPYFFFPNEEYRKLQKGKEALVTALIFLFYPSKEKVERDGGKGERSGERIRQKKKKNGGRERQTASQASSGMGKERERDKKSLRRRGQRRRKGPFLNHSLTNSLSWMWKKRRGVFQKKEEEGRTYYFAILF